VSNLVAEILLRLLKPLAALLLGLLIYGLLVGPLGAAPSPTLGLLCLVAAGVLILLIQESPL